MKFINFMPRKLLPSTTRSARVATSLKREASSNIMPKRKILVITKYYEKPFTRTTYAYSLLNFLSSAKSQLNPATMTGAIDSHGGCVIQMQKTWFRSRRRAKLRQRAKTRLKITHKMKFARIST